MHLENLRLQRNMENNDKQSDDIYQINTTDGKEYDERDHLGENKEEILNTHRKVLKLQKLSSQKK